MSRGDLSGVRRACARNLAIITVVLVLAAETPVGGSAADPIAEGLSELHRGHYTRAEETFRVAARHAPTDPEPQFFIAFSRWWRILLEDRRLAEDDAPFDAAIDAVIAIGGRRLEALPEDAPVMATVGAAHILRSHVEALRRNYFHAAQEARRGKKLLEAALEHDPGLTEALFPLGALNYYADKVPALVKGLRLLLFLPGGDADRGLDELRAVAASPAHFHTDARLLLSLICGSREEGCYTESVAQLRKALEENPGSPLILGSIGEIQMRIGRYDEAAQSFEAAMAGAQGGDADSARQRRTLRISIAEALTADWHLDRAAEVLQQADFDPGPGAPNAQKTEARVALELVAKRGVTAPSAPAADPPSPEAGSGAASRSEEYSGSLQQAFRAQEEGRKEEALTLAAQAVAERPDEALPRFVRGRMLFLRGRYAEAEADLAGAAERAPDPPPWMEGWIELYRGMAERSLGNARAARGHFRRASEMRKFRSADRGVLELRLIEPSNPRCTP